MLFFLVCPCASLSEMSHAREQEAHNWIRWARTPGHDAYWYYAPKFFEDIVPSAELTLEIGCGEGRVSRDLRDGGHDVIAIDASPALLQHAADATLSPLISSPIRRHFHFGPRSSISSALRMQLQLVRR
jgi:SAM-dependent methyltransferase